MNLDVRTAFLISSIIFLFMGIAILCYSMAKRANRIFLWTVMTSSSTAVMFYLMSLRGRVSDFFSIIFANMFVVLILMGCHEAFRSVLNLRVKRRVAGLLVLFLHTAALLYYTYIEPDFSSRVIVLSCSMTVMSGFIFQLFYKNWKKGERSITVIAAMPFILLTALSLTRIIIFLAGFNSPENSFNSGAFSISILIYSVVVSWNTLSLFFIANNRQQNLLMKMALHDPLTGVLNRRALTEALEREISRAERTNTPLCLIMTDLDHFKYVNDTYGHQAGDEILVHTIDLYKKIMRTEDILARYGGEEFVAVFPSSDIMHTLEIAERMRQICKTETLLFEKQFIPITASFGVAELNGSAKCCYELIKQADEALYKAKKEGRDRVVCYSQ